MNMTMNTTHPPAVMDDAIQLFGAASRSGRFAGRKQRAVYPPKSS